MGKNRVRMSVNQKCVEKWFDGIRSHWIGTRKRHDQDVRSSLGHLRSIMSIMSQS